MTAAPKGKKRLQSYVTADLYERFANAVVHLSGPSLFLNLSSATEAALGAFVERLEQEHNAGAAFPARGAVEMRGRPFLPYDPPTRIQPPTHCLSYNVADRVHCHRRYGHTGAHNAWVRGAPATATRLASWTARDGAE